MNQIKGAAKPTSNNSHPELLGNWINVHQHTKQTTMLEVGCGGGQFLQTATDYGLGTYAIDADRRMVESAREKINRGWGGFAIEQRLIGEPLPVMWPEVFDYVVSFQVIEHTEDPVAAFRWMHSLLSHIGVVVGSVPDKGKTVISKGSLLAELPTTDSDLVLINKHKNAFDIESIRSVLIDAGFSGCEVLPSSKNGKRRLIFRAWRTGS